MQWLPTGDGRLMSSVHTADMNAAETSRNAREPQNFVVFHSPHRWRTRPCPLRGHEALAHRRRTAHPTINRWRQAHARVALRWIRARRTRRTSQDSRRRHAAETPIPQGSAKRTPRKAGGTRDSAAARSSPAHERQEACRPGDRAGWLEPTHATRFSRGAGAGR